MCRRLWHTRATVVAAPYACGAAAPGRSCDTTRSRDSRGRRSRRIHASYGIARAQAGSPPEPQRRVYSRVKVCGHEYTSLAWFLGRGNPFPRDCHRAAATCGRNALELQNGDAKTLLARGFARGRPAQGKELLPGGLWPGWTLRAWQCEVVAPCSCSGLGVSVGAGASCGESVTCKRLLATEAPRRASAEMRRGANDRYMLRYAFYTSEVNSSSCGLMDKAAPS